MSVPLLYPIRNQGKNFLVFLRPSRHIPRQYLTFLLITAENMCISVTSLPAALLPKKLTTIKNRGSKTSFALE
jgi:hypothetical protein